jgi:hypothetical protein
LGGARVHQIYKVENILRCIYDKTGIPSRLELQKM